MSAPSERAAAKAAGLARYFTGRPCKHGHIAERRTSSGHCVVCHAQTQLRWDRRHREQRNTLRRERYLDDPDFAERCREYVRGSYLKKVSAPKETEISIVAHQGTHEQDEARKWVKKHARRLGVKSIFITDGIRNHWTLQEIEMLPVRDAQHLADHISAHRDVM